MKTNNVETKPIFPESEEAAKFVTGISGWTDRSGLFWGADEKMARYSGSTHRHCDCGAVIEQRSYCSACIRSREIEKYKNAQKIEWDKETPLYSQVHDKYLCNERELVEFMRECEVMSAEELELFICEPIRLSEIQSDHWADDLPEDCELPSEVEDALEDFNAVIRESRSTGWRPGKLAAIVKPNE